MNNKGLEEKTNIFPFPHSNHLDEWSSLAYGWNTRRSINLDKACENGLFTFRWGRSNEIGIQDKSLS
jgi:hypothetical protein